MNQAENDKLEAFLADLKAVYIKHNTYITSNENTWIKRIPLKDDLEKTVDIEIGYLRQSDYLYES